MKTLQNNKGDIKRVKDNEAELLVKNGWKYIPKSVWKDNR